MTALFKGLFRWSLQITGASIVWYNYQPYERQQKIIGIYGFLKNSYRFTKCLYGLSTDFKNYRQNVNPETLTTFKQNTAKRLEGLCQQNLGVYARIGEILSGYTDIIPAQYTTQFKKLFDKPLQGVQYSDIKYALTSIFQKDTKDLFDGFQTKPLNIGLFTQSHKAILLQNYREAVVKVLLPSLKVQADHDIWFINKVKDYVIDYLKKNNVDAGSFKLFVDTLEEAENVVRSEINLEQQISNAEKCKQLMYDGNSAFYVPYYFNKFCNQYIVIRQFVEGVQIDDVKGLKELGIAPELAFAYVLSQTSHMMNKLHLINGHLDSSNIMIRKYIKPYKAPTPTESEVVKQEERQTKNKSKPTALIHPPYQVIFLAQNNLQQIGNEAISSITSYWNSIKKEKKKVLPSVQSFYARLPRYQQLKTDPNLLKAQKFYLYEPLLKIYESVLKK